MKVDKFGQTVLTESEICGLYLGDPDRPPQQYYCLDNIEFDPDLELNNLPRIIKYIEQDCSIEQYDRTLQENWKMPEEYRNLDIVKWILDQCQSDSERQRVGEELLLYVDRNLISLLQYLKYLVDTMRKNGVVWGVGRGSSVSSYVLYLLGVHKINSMYYDLDISEFLR
jgi:DNA polymerase III alpha subunit